MKRKLLKKVTGVLLASTLIMGLVACGNEPASNKTSETEVKTTESAVSSETAAQPTEEVFEVTYPIKDATPLSVWFAGGLGFDAGDGSQIPFTQGLAEKTGVTVEWQKPVAGSNANEAYNLLLTEKELPNIIYHGILPTAAEELLDDGVIYDLTDYIPTYAPDYWEFINSHEGLLNNLVTESGRIYGFNSLDEEGYNATYTGPVVRKDWLDECGLQVPVTLEDWEKVLVAFKDKYGVAMGFSVSRFLNQAGLASGTGAYATMAPTLYVDDNGKIQLAQAQPEWKEYMEVLNRWYDMGLIDKDSLTMDDKAVRTKVANNEIGISFTAMSQLTLFVNDAVAAGSDAEWIGIEYPRTAAGEPTSMIQQTILHVNNNIAVITKSCSEEELITALQFLNYGYSEEGIMYWNYGDENVSYTLDKDGKPQWTDLVAKDADGIAKGMDKYTGARNAGITIQMADVVRAVNSEAAINSVYEWIENTEVEKHIVPRIALTPDESAAYSDIMTAINARVSEMCMKYITGDESLDNFDAFVAELKSMKLDEALKLQQDAYDRWLNR